MDRDNFAVDNIASDKFTLWQNMKIDNFAHIFLYSFVKTHDFF